MRADRLLSILLLLQVNRRMTANELAGRLEVSERTIYRDMEALSAAGIPVTAERGANGGWMLLEPYETNLTGLNPAEIQALFVTQPAHVLSDLGLGKAADAALIKLLAAVPSMHRQGAEYVRQRLHIDVGGWKRGEENVACLPALQDAIWQELKLKMTYRRYEHPDVERLVDPLGLVAKGSVWYLVAAVDGKIRTYRASRIVDAVPTGENFKRPENFDLSQFWVQSSAEFMAALPRYPVKARARSELVPKMKYWHYTRVELSEPPDADGWCIVHIMFEIEQSALEYGLAYGAEMEILEPSELHEKILTLAQQTVKLYSK